MKKKSRIRPRRRAGALAFALIITACLAVCAGAVLSLAGSEHKLTLRRVLFCEARNTAESTINYGISQVVRMTANGNYVAADFLSTQPLKVPANGNFGTDGLARIDSSGLSLIGGRALIANKAVLIPTGNPTSATDDGKGHWVFTKTVPMLVSVTATPPVGDPVKVYAKAHLVIRDDPLFNYAVFYNNIPLEIAPGGTFVIGGDVRTNSDIYLANSFKINGTVHSAGSIRSGRSPVSGLSGAPGSIYVAYKDADNNGTFDPVTGWNYDASKIAKGQDPFFTPDAKAELIGLNFTDENGNAQFLDSTRADWKTLASTLTNGNVQDSAQGVGKIMPPGINSEQGASIIQPPVTDKSSPDYNADIESVKYGNKAGLYMVVEPNGTVTAFQNSADAGAYKTSSDRTDWKATHSDKILDLSGTDIVSINAFKDRREGKAVTSVDLDVGHLRDYVAGTAKSGAPAFADKSSYALDTPDANGWNGVVYVDVEKPSAGWQPFTTTDSTGTTVTTASTLTAVRLRNATEVPNRSATNPAGSVGFTLATNAPMYTVGNVNSDGDSSTGSNSLPDSKSTAKLGKECPVSLAADAITTLSSNWTDAHSAANDTTSTPGFTEISAALTVGIVKSEGSKYSGGLENFPRLLEQWGGQTLRIRGSMVALYESKIATGKWNQGVYGIPSRDWGFSQIFGDGMYPPGTPIIRSYRRMNFRYLSAAEYAAEKKAEWTKADGSTAAKFPW